MGHRHVVCAWSRTTVTRTCCRHPPVRFCWLPAHCALALILQQWDDTCAARGALPTLHGPDPRRERHACARAHAITWMWPSASPACPLPLPTPYTRHTYTTPPESDAGRAPMALPTASSVRAGMRPTTGDLGGQHEGHPYREYARGASASASNIVLTFPINKVVRVPRLAPQHRCALRAANAKRVRLVACAGPAQHGCPMAWPSAVAANNLPLCWHTRWVVRPPPLWPPWHGVQQRFSASNSQDAQ